MSTNHNYKKWRPGSNAAFGCNNGILDLMRPSAAKWHSSIVGGGGRGGGEE